MTLILFTLIVVSCQSEEGTNAEAEIDLKSTETEAALDKVSDETSVIIEEAYLIEAFPETKSSANERYLPDCVTITVVLVQNMKTVTVDFGEGCELRNGNVVAGKLILEYEKDPEAATKLISFEFDGFVFNDKEVSGGGSVLRKRANDNGNPESTKTADVTATWPDGTFANKNGTKVREWIEGYGTGAWGDNVYSITGNWTFTKKNGTVLNAQITEPLRRELACKFIVSGTIALSKNDSSVLLNYGDGNCDDLATVSFNDGAEREIHLSNLR